MAKFKFSLEKILKIREFEEEQAKIELGKAIAETERLKQNLKNIAQQRVKYSREIGNSLDLAYLSSIENYIKGLDVQKENFLEQLAQAELVVEEKQKLMTEAMQRRKALDKLKEKQFNQFKYEQELAEENILDDMNGNRATNEARAANVSRAKK